MQVYRNDCDHERGTLDEIPLHRTGIFAGQEMGQDSFLEDANTITTAATRYINERFVSLFEQQVLMDAMVFEHALWPDSTDVAFSMYGNVEVQRLLSQFQHLFEQLHGDCNKIRSQWRSLKTFVSKQAQFKRMEDKTLWPHLMDHFSCQGNDQHFYDILLLVVITQTIALDTSV